MPTIDFGEKDLYAGVTEDFPFTAALYQSDGATAAALAAGDVVHLMLSTRTRGEPTADVLHLQSDAEAAGESRIYITDLGNAGTGAPAVGYVRFAQADTITIVNAWAATKLSERYVCELWYVDASESNPANAKKIFLRGIIHLHRSAAA